MNSPLNTSNKENRLSNLDTLDSSNSIFHKTHLPKRTRLPGKLTTTTQEPFSSVQIIDQLLHLKNTKDTTNQHTFQELDEIITSLLSKNDALVAQNLRLSKQNSQLHNKIFTLEEQIQLLRGMQQTRGESESLMEYFDGMSMKPIVGEVDGHAFGIEKPLCMCKEDSNSNFRAFYLSMLQEESTRCFLQQMVSHYESDDSWKLIPLLSSNESWVQLSDNFFRVLRDNPSEQLDEVYNFINQSQLYDVIFISALRSRVQFLSQGSYCSQINTLELYTALSNIFGDCTSSLQHSQHVNYDQYTFTMAETSFSIYFVQHTNQFAVCFHQPQRLLTSAQSCIASTPRANSEVVEGDDSYHSSGMGMREESGQLRRLGPRSLRSSVSGNERVMRYPTMEDDSE